MTTSGVELYDVTVGPIKVTMRLETFHLESNCIINIPVASQVNYQSDISHEVDMIREIESVIENNKQSFIDVSIDAITVDKIRRYNEHKIGQVVSILRKNGY